MARMTKEEKLALINTDPKLWLKNFVKIIDNNGEMIPFYVNEQQEQFIDEMQKFNIISKARQIGLTTLSLGLCLFYACNTPNTNYLIVSYKADASSALFEKLKFMYDNLPHERFSFPKIKRSNRSEFVLSNNSRIQCVIAGNKDIGRGNTYQYILLSEFAFYQNQEKLILGAEQALAKNATSKVVIETTSNGFNHYQKIFMNAFKGKSKYKAFFFPFYSSAYKKQFKHEYDQAEKWFKETNRGCRLSADDLEPEEKLLHEKGVSLRMLMWRRWKLLDMSIQEFFQEFPSNPMESFISTGFNVFDQTKVIDAISNATEHLPSSELSELPESLVRYFNKGLNVYYLPKSKMRYYAGIDVSGGSGGDYSAISIFDSDGQQVASFYHNKIAVYQFARIINDLGRFYNQAFLVVERNSYGLPLLERLRKEYEYLNIYKQKTFDQQSGKKKMRLGWMTTSVNKGIMISDLKENFELGMLKINCKETLEQMQIFIDTDGKLGNKGGSTKHDDCVIATALAVQGIKSSKWYV